MEWTSKSGKRLSVTERLALSGKPPRGPLRVSCLHSHIIALVVIGGPHVSANAYINSLVRRSSAIFFRSREVFASRLPTVFLMSSCRRRYIPLHEPCVVKMDDDFPDFDFSSFCGPEDLADLSELYQVPPPAPPLPPPPPSQQPTLTQMMPPSSMPMAPPHDEHTKNLNKLQQPKPVSEGLVLARLCVARLVSKR